MHLLIRRTLGWVGCLVAFAAHSQDSPPTITLQPRSQSVSLGANVTLRVAASPPAGIAIRWERNEVEIQGATNSTLILTNMQAMHTGDYRAHAANAFGTATSQVAAVQVDPSFIKITTGPVATEGGDSSGALWCDFNQDGWPDLFVGNSPSRNALYRNNGDGTFAKLTGLAPTLDSGFGGAWGDFNNDGWPDLFVANGGANYLYRNNGNDTFTKVVPFAGAIGATSWSGSWADYDRDGWLDLFISNGAGNSDILLHNNQDGTFTRINTTPVSKSGGVSIAGAWADYDRDGWPDLYVANNGGVSFLFRNLDGGAFSRVTNGRLVTDSQSAIVGDWGDYDGDGWLDLAIGVLSRNLLFRNLGDGTFTKQTTGPVVIDSQNSELVQWGDYDNDGWLDLISINAGGQNNSLYHSNGHGAFTRIMTGSLVNDGGSSAGGSWTDYDNDGFLDLFVANWQGSRPNFLYRNAGNSNRWLKIRCVGSGSNRSAIGALVSVTARIRDVERTQVRQISGGIGFGQLELPAHFGLGDAETVASIRIEWPSGTIQSLGPVASSRTLVVHEPARLNKPTLDGSERRLEFLGVPQGHYRVETSSDLRLWQTLLTEPVAQAPGRFVVPITSMNDTHEYFRVLEF